MTELNQRVGMACPVPLADHRDPCGRGPRVHVDLDAVHDHVGVSGVNILHPYGEHALAPRILGAARYPLADYVKHRMKGFFDLLVTDEVHEYKGRGSAQGIAAGVLADACGKSLSLSGTLDGRVQLDAVPSPLQVCAKKRLS